MIDSEASHSFVAKPMVKSQLWLVHITEPMCICVATRSEVVLDWMCTVPIVALSYW